MDAEAREWLRLVADRESGDALLSSDTFCHALAKLFPASALDERALARNWPTAYNAECSANGVPERALVPEVDATQAALARNALAVRAALRKQSPARELQLLLRHSERCPAPAPQALSPQHHPRFSGARSRPVAPPPARAVPPLPTPSAWLLAPFNTQSSTTSLCSASSASSLSTLDSAVAHAAPSAAEQAGFALVDNEHADAASEWVDLGVAATDNDDINSLLQRATSPRAAPAHRLAAWRALTSSKDPVATDALRSAPWREAATRRAGVAPETTTRHIGELCARGVPEALRASVWPRLASADRRSALPDPGALTADGLADALRRRVPGLVRVDGDSRVAEAAQLVQEVVGAQDAAFWTLAHALEHMTQLDGACSSGVSAQVDALALSAMLHETAPEAMRAARAAGSADAQLLVRALPVTRWLRGWFVFSAPRELRGFTVRLWDVFLWEGEAALFAAAGLLASKAQPRLVRGLADGNEGAFSDALRAVAADAAELDKFMVDAQRQCASVRARLLALRRRYRPLVTARLARELASNTTEKHLRRALMRMQKRQRDTLRSAGADHVVRAISTHMQSTCS